MNQSITRRRLLLASGAATAVPFQAVRGAEANSAVTVGLIGAGGRGTTVARALVENTGARLTAIAELYDERVAQAKQRIGVKDPEIFKDYRELLASDVDAVIIATPVFLHAEHFEEAVKAGKHIYIEKPAAADVAGRKRIMRAADSAGRRLNIAFGFQRRYGEVYHRAKALLDSGALGKMQMAHVRFIKRAAPQRAGDMMDHGNVTFHYGGGVSGSLTGTTLGPPGYRDVAEQFFGSEGVVETAAEYWKHFSGGKFVLHEESPRNTTVDAMAEFVRRIAEGRPENTGARGAESTLTAIMGRMAMELERKVSWDEVLQAG
jgi:predicted dehydrogenase